MAYKKLVNKSGGITIPSQLRHEVGIYYKTPLDLEVTEKGILLKQSIPVCMMCGSVDDVKEVNKYCICKKCADEAVRRFKNE